jgi:hypothetical protein
MENLINCNEIGTNAKHMFENGRSNDKRTGVFPFWGVS